MKVQQLLAHHGIQDNPFGQEDAQDDAVFRQHCLQGVHHPAWDKIFGSASNPSTAVVFGEKGSGKTALRIQIVDQIARHNQANPAERVFVIEYDDLNPFIDCFHERQWGTSRKPERSLKNWRLLDHMDAILSLGVTRLVSAILGESSLPAGFEVDPTRVQKLDRMQRRDLLLLATFYDYTLSMPHPKRWSLLRRKLRFSNWQASLDIAGATLGSATLLGILAYTHNLGQLIASRPWPWALFFVMWAPWLWRQFRLWWSATRTVRQVRVRELSANVLRKLLSRFTRNDLLDQPIPSRDRTDDRYALLSKLQSILSTLGYPRILVIVDRVDEPQLVNGVAERMRDLIWPLFDNKFLNHLGLAFKLLLPVEISFYLQKEGREFFERSRLDKHNLVKSLEWTGESLYDIANARLQACRTDPQAKVTIRSLFDPALSQQELIGSLERLRVPRHVFKFLFRLLVEHCNRHTDDNPVWTISRESLQTTLALYQRDLAEFDRGMGTG